MDNNRKENLQRLNSAVVGADHPHYLHYVFYHHDLFEAFDTYASGRMLDIGCGNKPYKNQIGNKVTEYVGCDIIQSSENCVDVLCEATHIPLPDESFDTVISTQTIEHVADHQALVNEAARLLKSGGYFIVSGPMYWPLHEEPYDFFRITKHGFRYVLGKAGLEVVEEKSNGGKWSLAGQALIHALYPEVYFKKGLKTKVIRKLFNMWGGLERMNHFFEKMDRKYKNEVNTMNYVFIARKK